MTVAQLITKMRSENGDTPILTGEKFDGDGAITAFRLKYTTILESSYTVKISGVVQVENTDYTIDRHSGLIVFTSAPADADDNVTVDYKYAKLDDAAWLDILNGVISELKEKLWDDKLDTTTLTTVANQSEYSLDTISTRIKDIVGLWYRMSANSDWTSIDTSTNVEFWELQNVLNVRPYFQHAGYAIKVRYLEYFDQYTTTSQNVVIPDNYLEAVKYFARVRFLDRIISKMSLQLGAVATEPTYQPMNNIINARKTFLGQAESCLARVKPRRPATRIAKIKFGKKS